MNPETLKTLIAMSQTPDGQIDIERFTLLLVNDVVATLHDYHAYKVSRHPEPYHDPAITRAVQNYVSLICDKYGLFDSENDTTHTQFVMDANGI